MNCPCCGKRATFTGTAMGTRVPENFYRCDNGCKASEPPAGINKREDRYQFVEVEHPDGGDPIQVSEVW